MASFWDLELDRILCQLDGWKKAFISLGGGKTLVQSCLSFIPTFFLSIFKVPITYKIDKL